MLRKTELLSYSFISNKDLMSIFVNNFLISSMAYFFSYCQCLSYSILLNDLPSIENVSCLLIAFCSSISFLFHPTQWLAIYLELYSCHVIALCSFYSNTKSILGFLGISNLDTHNCLQNCYQIQWIGKLLSIRQHPLGLIIWNTMRLFIVRIAEFWMVNSLKSKLLLTGMCCDWLHCGPG